MLILLRSALAELERELDDGGAVVVVGLLYRKSSLLVLQWKNLVLTSLESSLGIFGFAAEFFTLDCVCAKGATLLNHF